MENKTHRYTETHEWARDDDGLVTIGISAHAAGQVSDIVFVELPEAGQVVKKGEPFGTIESVKAVFDLNAPVSGKVAAVNGAVAEDPEIVNRSPEDEGWLIRVEPGDPGEIDTLMDAGRYGEFTAGS